MLTKLPPGGSVLSLCFGSHWMPSLGIQLSGRAIGCSPIGPWFKSVCPLKIFGSGGIRTHASEETGALNQRLRPLGHATCLQMSTSDIHHKRHYSKKPFKSLICDEQVKKKIMAAVGFEPTPPKRLVPKTSALDRSATLPSYETNEIEFVIIFLFEILKVQNMLINSHFN